MPLCTGQVVIVEVGQKWRTKISRIATEIKYNSACFLQLRQSCVEVSVVDPADIDIENSFFNFRNLGRPRFLYRSGAGFVLQSNLFGFARIRKRLDCEIHGLPFRAQVEQAQSIPAYPLWSS